VKIIKIVATRGPIVRLTCNK